MEEAPLSRLDEVLATLAYAPGRQAASSKSGIRRHDRAAERLAASPPGWLTEVRRSLSGAEFLESASVRRLEDVAETGVMPGAEAVSLIEAIAAGTAPLPVSWWLMLHCRLFRTGLIEASYVAKNAAARTVLASHQVWADLDVNAETLLAAAVFLAEDEEIDRTASRIASQGAGWIAPPRLRRMQLDALLAVNDLVAARDVFARTMSSADRRLADRVSGRSLVVLGLTEPASGIDGKLTVALDSIAPRCDGIMPADLSYYGRTAVRHRTAGVRAALAGHPDTTAMFGFRDVNAVARLTEGLPVQRIRLFSGSGSVFFGGGSPVRHAVSDLLLFPVSEIEIRMHGGLFLPEGAAGREDIDRELLSHDILETWSFLRRLGESGAVRNDAALARLLDTGKSEFVRFG